MLWDRGLRGVELRLSTLSKRLGRFAFESLISHNIVMIASQLYEEVDGCVTVGRVLTVSLFPRKESSFSLLITFLASVTDILALAEAVTHFLALGNIFFQDGIFTVRENTKNFNLTLFLISKIICVPNALQFESDQDLNWRQTSVVLICDWLTRGQV